MIVSKAPQKNDRRMDRFTRRGAGVDCGTVER